MKIKKSLICLVIISVCLFTGCGKNKEDNENANDDSFVGSSDITEASEYDSSDDSDVKTNEEDSIDDNDAETDVDLESSPYASYDIYPIENLYVTDKETYDTIKGLQGNISAIGLGSDFPVFLVKDKVYCVEYGKVTTMFELNEEPDDIFYFSSIELGDNLFSFFDGKITNYDRYQGIRFANIEFNEETDFISHMPMSSYFNMTSKQSDNTILHKYYEGSDGTDMTLSYEKVMDKFETPDGDAVDLKDMFFFRNRYMGYNAFCLTTDNEVYMLGNVGKRTYEMNTRNPILSDVDTLYATSGLAEAITSPIYSKLGEDKTVVYATVRGEQILSNDDDVAISFPLPDGHQAEEIETIFEVSTKVVFVFNNGDTYITEDISETDERAYELMKLENISSLIQDGTIVEITGMTHSILFEESIYILMNDGVLYYYEIQ